MRRHNEFNVVQHLSRKHDVRVISAHKQVMILNGKSKKAPKRHDLGIGSWGKIDFLVNHCGYIRSNVSEFN